jgi:hypothetical protein
VAQFNEAQLARMQLLAGATPEFMNFSHFVLESCLVRTLLRDSCCCVMILKPCDLSICSLQYAQKQPWANGAGPPLPQQPIASAAAKAAKAPPLTHKIDGT